MMPEEPVGLVAPKRFVLVHGGRHGAWCWTHIISELRARGHVAVAVDLPGHGTRASEIQSFEGYRETIVSVLRPGDVLVGHSMGCGVAVVAANDCPHIAHLCLVAGELPVEGGPMIGMAPSLDEFIANMKSTGSNVHVAPDEDYSVIDFDDAYARYFGDCSEEVAKWAFSRLVPQRISLMSTRVSLPGFWSSDVPRSYVQCTKDVALPKERSDTTIRRLGVEPLRIETSHSPFLSRPVELVDTLMRAINTDPIGSLLPR